MAAVTSNEDDPRAKRVNNIKVYGTSARSSYFYLVELNEIHCHVSTQTSRSLETFSRCASFEPRTGSGSSFVSSDVISITHKEDRLFYTWEEILKTWSKNDWRGVLNESSRMFVKFQQLFNLLNFSQSSESWYRKFIHL